MTGYKPVPGFSWPWGLMGIAVWLLIASAVQCMCYAHPDESLQRILYALVVFGARELMTAAMGR